MKLLIVYSFQKKVTQSEEYLNVIQIPKVIQIP